MSTGEIPKDGNISRLVKVSDSDIKRRKVDFWKRVSIGEIDECWEWMSGCVKGGYGRFYIKKKMIYAHRFSFAEKYGAGAVNGVLVLHKCDNRKCCNPNHLFAGNTKKNYYDALHKGRNRSRRIKLSPEIAKEIRLLKTFLSAEDVAKLYSVTKSTIFRIWRGIRWSKPEMLNACNSL